MAEADCSCTGSNLDRFVRPCVMAVLAGHPGGLHGYVVAQHLQDIAIFGDNPPDMTGLYRVLKALESEGYLSSTWDIEGSGPARHIYALTESGRDCLCQWATTLRAYTTNLQKTVTFIDQSVQPMEATINPCNRASCRC